MLIIINIRNEIEIRSDLRILKNMPFNLFRFNLLQNPKMNKTIALANRILFLESNKTRGFQWNGIVRCNFIKAENGKTYVIISDEICREIFQSTECRAYLRTYRR